MIDEEPQESDRPAGDRRALVQRAVRIWTRQLIDLGARNNLLFYKDLKQGTISFNDATASGVNELLARRKVRLGRLFPDSIEAQARRARTIRKKAQELFEERGLEALYLACGLATWDSVGPTPAAPVLLAPIRLTPRGSAQEDFDLEISGELEVNPTLLHLLQTEFSVSCSAEELLSHTEIEGAIDTPDELSAVYRWLEGHTRTVPGFVVSEQLVLGTFAYAKLPMVKDLEASEEALVEHELIAALAGDSAARQAVRSRITSVDATEPNRIPPADEFLILDADSSQNWAINACLAGQDVIVRGPPGTGKSQTIANLIATLVARDKRVLFVAEKRAAIDAVLGRLDKCDLSDLVLDLHGGSGSKKKLARALAQTLDTHASLTLPRLSEQHADLTKRRDQLNRRAEALHERRKPWDISVYELQAELIGFNDVTDVGVRFRNKVLKKLGRESYRAAREELSEWSGLGGSMLTASGNPWATAELVSAEDVRSTLELLLDLRDHSLGSAEQAMRTATEAVGYTWPESINEWEAFLGLAGRTETLLTSVTPQVFELDLPAVATALEPATHGLGSWMMAATFSGVYRQAKRQMRGALKPNTKLPAAALRAAAVEAGALSEAWKGDGSPAVPDGLSALVAQIERLRASLRGSDRSFIATICWRSRPSGWGGISSPCCRNSRPWHRLPELYRLRVALSGRGLDRFLAAVSDRALETEHVVRGFDYAWYASIHDWIAPEDPESAPSMGSGTGRRSPRTARRTTLISRRLRHGSSGAVAERATRARDEHMDEATLVQQQAARRAATSQCDEMFERAPNVIGALKPCWAMSPLVVSQLLPRGGDPWFDVVIFDEASQVTPRRRDPGHRCVADGSSSPATSTSCRRPTSSPRRILGRTRRTKSDDGQDAVGRRRASSRSSTSLDGRSSRSRMLEWHYRSRDERLIAFSNAHLYDRSLTTFPGVAGDGVPRHVSVRIDAGRRRIRRDQSPPRSTRSSSWSSSTPRRGPTSPSASSPWASSTPNRIEEALRRALDSSVPSSTTSSTRTATSGSSSRTSSASRATSATRSSCRSATARTPTAGCCTASARSTTRAASGASTSRSPGPSGG